mmetsp:Transcript_31674/g.45610  ORF Transcript_31674/g.45610 Transcript_31674/m.45610 type:complete len:180 (-) Transcript_31674:258-797(-)
MFLPKSLLLQRSISSLFILSKEPMARFLKNIVVFSILQAAFFSPKFANAESNDKNKLNDGNDKKTEKGWLFEFANNAKKASEEGDFYGKFKNGVKDVILTASASAPLGFDDKIKSFLESRMPGEIGYGLLMGYSSGYFLKKVSKVLAFVLGGTFVVLQSLSYSGVVKIDYDKMQKTVEL